SLLSTAAVPIRPRRFFLGAKDSSPDCHGCSEFRYSPDREFSRSDVMPRGFVLLPLCACPVYLTPRLGDHGSNRIAQLPLFCLRSSLSPEPRSRLQDIYPVTPASLPECRGRKACDDPSVRAPSLV